MQKYQKILIKLSGEVLGGKGKNIFDEQKILAVAGEIAELVKKYQIAIYIGGGNIFRWRENHLSFLDRVTGDWIGIKATILNGLILLGALRNKYKCPVKMFSDHEINLIFEKYQSRQAKKYLNGNNIIIITSQGKSGQTNDTNAAQAAKDLDCKILLKGSKVDGVYSADPKKNKNAKFYKELSYKEAIDRKLKIMDEKAFKICRTNEIPIVVFNLYKSGNIKKAIEGETGSIVK